MGKRFGLLALFLIFLLTGCKDEVKNSEIDIAKEIALKYEAMELPYFAYNAEDQSQRNTGFGVETFSNEGELLSATEFALKNKEMVYGIRTIDGEYIYSSMKYFDENQFQEAQDYTKANNIGCIMDLKHGISLPGWWLTDDKFVVGQTSTHGKVSIICDKNNYYMVTIDLKDKPNMEEVGKDFGRCISDMPIFYVARITAYLAGSLDVEQISPSDAYKRVEALAKEIPQADRDLINGMSKTIDGANEHLASLMLYTANLLPDALRPTACSAFGVMPAMSENGKTMVYRTLDWPDAIYEDLPYYIKWFITKERGGLVSPLQSITKIIYPDRTIYSFGMLGIVCGVTSIDATHKNMVAILDASTDDAYNYKNKKSYVFDLAETLRTRTTIDEMAKDMSTHEYTFNHLLLMANTDKVGIFENNLLLKPEGRGKRAMRYWDSPTGDIFPKWYKDNMIGAVNCFMLEGQVDNSNVNPSLCNLNRWKQMQDKVKELLDKKGANGKLSAEDLQMIQSTYSGTLNPKKFDNLYSFNTLQMVQYIPEDNVAYVYLKSFDGKPKANPTYFKLSLNP